MEHQAGEHRCHITDDGANLGDRVASAQATEAHTKLVGPPTRQVIPHDPRTQFSIFTLDSQNHTVRRQHPATDSRSTRMTAAETGPGLSTANKEEARRDGV